MLAAVLAVVVPAVEIGGLHFPGRAVLALLFVVLVPGAPLTALLRLRSFPLTLAVTFATSLSVLLLLCTTLVVSTLWQPLLAIALMSIAGLYLTWPALRAVDAEPRLPAPARRVRPERALGLAAAGGSVLLWLVAVARVDLSALGGFGLLSVVGPAYWAALGLLAATAAWQLLRDEPDGLVLTVVVALLIVEMFGFLNIADGAASVSTGWLHVGFAQYISDHGHVAHYLDARFSWPGFFASAAVLADAGGTGTAIPFLRPAPVLNLLLLLPGLWSIALTITGKRTVAWLSMLVFFSLNWYQQDYFSPQATVFILYVGVLAMMLHLAPAPVELRGADAPWRHPLRGLSTTAPRPEGVGPGLALGREALLLLVCSAVVVSHQLTPLNLLVILVVLVVTGATRMRGLWLLVTLVFIAWFTFGAQEYWRGNIASVFGDIGHLGSTVGSAVGNRLVGDPVHSRMQTLRLAWSASSVLLGLVTLRRLRHSTWVWTLAGAALGPFSLVFVQSYGGEVALRAFLYADPVLAPLVAMTVWAALSAVPVRGQRAALAGALLVGFVLLTATRGANASFERETTVDIAASRYLFDHGPRGQTIGLLQSVSFAGFERVTEWTPVPLDAESCDGIDVEPCVELKSPLMLLVTRRMDRLGELQEGLHRGWTTDVVNELEAKGLYTSVFHRPGATVLRRVGGR